MTIGPQICQRERSPKDGFIMKGAASDHSLCQGKARLKTQQRWWWRGSQHCLGVGPDDLLT